MLKVADLEAHAGPGPSDLLKDELSQSLEELEALLKAKDEVGTEPRDVSRGLPHPQTHSAHSFSLFLGDPHFAKQKSQLPSDGACQG